MTALFLIFFFWLVYLMLTPGRVMFDTYTEWSFFNADGSDRGVVVIDPEWRDHPDYHAPDAIRRVPREQGAKGPGWVKRVAWAAVVLGLIIVTSYVS